MSDRIEAMPHEAQPMPHEELFWGGYLTALYRAGAVTSLTPASEIERMKVEFLFGIRGGASTSAGGDS